MHLPLSVLDLSPIPSGSATEALNNTLALAQLSERLGYTRYWLAEHHNMTAFACSSPEILIGQVARVTSRIRVGSGGIMLPNHAPLKVAQPVHWHPGDGAGRDPGAGAPDGGR